MSTFAIDGLASGLDTTTIVNQLMQLEGQPQQRLRSQLARQDVVISAYQSVSTRLKAVDTAADALSADAAWNARSATVSGSSVAVTASAGAAVDSTEITVSSLATRASWLTDAAYGLDQNVFNGFPITVTKADNTTVSLSPSSGTMRDVMASINSAAGAGIRAVAIKVGTDPSGVDQYRLQVLSTDTGTAAATKSVTGLGVATTATAATNAAYTINGVPATSGSNTVGDAVSGLSVTLLTAGTSTVTVAQDTGKLADKIQALVTAVNNALTEVTNQSVRDASTPRGPLANDSAVRALSGRLLQAVSDVVGSTSAAKFGLETQRSGQLAFNRDTFTAQYTADPVLARSVLAPTVGLGVTQRLSSIVDGATTAGTGSLTSAIEGRSTSKTDLQTQINSWDRRLGLRRSALERQFSNLEVAMQRMQSQQARLSGQLNSLNASR